MSHTERDHAKLRNRIKRIHGQIESVERTLSTDEHDCAQVLMLLAAVRGGINSLMAEVLEDHIRLHLLAGRPRSADARPRRGADRPGPRLSEVNLSLRANRHQADPTQQCGSAFWTSPGSPNALQYPLQMLGEGPLFARQRSCGWFRDGSRAINDSATIQGAEA